MDQRISIPRGIGTRHRRAVVAGVLGLVLLMALWLAGAVAGWAVLVLGAAFAGWLLVLERAGAEEVAEDRVHQELLPADMPVAADLPFRSALAAFPDPVILVDGQGRVLASNAKSHSLIGSAHPGRHVSGVLRAPAVLVAVERALSGALTETEEVEFTLPVPYDQHLMAFVAPIDLGGASEQGVLLAFRDLTALKRTEQMRADFVANASHELRTPLSSLTGFIETLRGPARDDEPARERFLEIMHDQASRMRRLIDDLLSLSRIELNEHVPPAHRVDLMQAVQDVADAVGPLARAEGVSITVAGGEAMPPVIGDRDELVQVLQNLFDNAIKYGREGGRIEVTLGSRRPKSAAMPAQDAVFVAVRDFGPGIPREHIPRLTERFYRVDAKTSRERGGTGLGLAIVKHILNRHRGALEIQSKISEGTVVTIYVPAGPIPLTPVVAAPSAEVRAPQ